MMKNIIFTSRRIGQKFSRNLCTVSNTPVKLSYISYDEKTPKEKSQKSPILMMHGVLDSKATFKTLSKSLNLLTKRTTIAVDIRNHGDSPHAPKLSYPEMSKDVQHLYETLKLSQTVMIGHSMSGGTAMFTALKYPDLTEKLIVIDANPIYTSPMVYDMLANMKAVSSINFEGLQTLYEARNHADDILSRTIESPNIRNFFLANLKEESPGHLKWTVNLPVVVRDFSKYIIKFPALVPELLTEPFTKPVLLIGGANSDWLRSEHFEPIRKLFPNADFVLIKRAHHWPHLQQPEEFLKISSEFINSN